MPIVTVECSELHRREKADGRGAGGCAGRIWPFARPEKISMRIYTMLRQHSRRYPGKCPGNMQTAPGSLRWRSPAVTSTAAPGEGSESPAPSESAVLLPAAGSDSRRTRSPRAAGGPCKGCRRPMRTAGNGFFLTRLDRTGHVTVGKAGRRATGPNRTAGSGPPALASAAVTARRACRADVTRKAGRQPPRILSLRPRVLSRVLPGPSSLRCDPSP